MWSCMPDLKELTFSVLGTWLPGSLFFLGVGESILVIVNPLSELLVVLDPPPPPTPACLPCTHALALLCWFCFASLGIIGQGLIVFF